MSDNHAWHDLLSQLGLALLDRGEEDVTDRTLWHSVQSSAGKSHCEQVQVLGSTVVSAVQKRGTWETARDLSLDATTASLSSFAHYDRFS